VYDVPPSILMPLAVSALHSLRRSTVSDLDKESEWESPRSNRLHIREWSPVGAGQFLIHPRPLAATDVTVEGLAAHEEAQDDGMIKWFHTDSPKTVDAAFAWADGAPPGMINPATGGWDVLPVRPEYEQCIEDWCVERAAFKTGGQLLATYRPQYEGFLNMAQRIRGMEIAHLEPLLPEGAVDGGGVKERIEGNG